jgi:hypothetical protein
VSWRADPSEWVTARYDDGHAELQVFGHPDEPPRRSVRWAAKNPATKRAQIEVSTFPGVSWAVVRLQFGSLRSGGYRQKAKPVEWHVVELD